MKKLLALLLLFGIVGCALSPEIPNRSYVDYGKGASISLSENARKEYGKRESRVNFCSLYYSDVECKKEYPYRFGYSINLRTDEFYYLFDVPKSILRKDFMRTMQMKCVETFASECVIGGVEGNTIYYSGRQYRDKTENMNFAEKRNFIINAIVDGIQDGSIGIDLSDDSDSSTAEIQAEIEELRREITTLIIQENLKNN